MQTQHGYGLPQSRLSAATAAARYLDANLLKQPRQAGDIAAKAPAPTIN